MSRAFALLLAVVTISLAAGVLPHAVGAADSIDPASIDIYDPAAAEFLDTDTGQLFDLAWQAYVDGDYEKSAQYYLALLHTDYGDSSTMYNLACCYGLLGEATLAADFLERAFAAGFSDVAHVESDSDMDPVRDQPVFQAAMDRLRASADEQEAELGNVVFFKEPVFLRGRVYLPDAYDPREEYPLVVGLHGLGSQPDRFVKLWKRFETMDFIYVVPQAPYPFLSNAGTVGYSWGYHTATDLLPPRSWKMSQDYVGNVIEQMRSLYRISDVYLLGFSQGAGMALAAGIANHNQVTGVIALSGWLEDEWLCSNELAHSSDLRIFIAHGTRDAIIEIDNGRRAYEELLANGFDVTFHEFDGGHEVPEDVVYAAEQWMRTLPAVESGAE